MEELQPGALQGDGPLGAAAVLAIAPERMLPGGKLHPDLMGPPGVEGDVRQTERSIFCCGRNAVLQYSFFHTLAGTADREDPAFPAVLEQVIPQSTLSGEHFVRAACNHSPVLFDKTGSGGCPLGPAILHGIGLLAPRYLTAQGRCRLRGLCIDHQARDAGVQTVDDADVSVRLPPLLPEPQRHALFAGVPGGLVQHYKGIVFIDDKTHSLPSSSRALSLSTPAMVLPSLISPLMTIS